MATEQRVKQLEDVMVEMLRKQGRTIEEVAGLREGQSELNTKVVRLENRVERLESKVDDNTRNLLNLSRTVEEMQQQMNAGFTRIIDLIRGSK